MGYSQPFAALRRFSLWFVVLTLALSTASCGGGGGGGGGTETKSIVGAWTATVASCTDTYTFGADSSFQSTSSAEIITGTYTFDTTAGKGDAHALTINMATDNGGIDCTGATTDSTGVYDIGVIFRGNEIDLYAGDTFVITLTKTL